MISVSELTRLLSEGPSERELAEAIMSDPLLNAKFELEGDYLTERHTGTAIDRLGEESRSRLRAKSNLMYATRFAQLLRPSRFKMVAVSGSTSYGSASRSKDLDLFCVAPTGQLWYSLAWGLIMARIFGFISPQSPVLCFSCIMDEWFAHSKFSEVQGPLFARDALETKVIKGHDVYKSLMRAAEWISAFYPAAYEPSEYSGAPTTTEKRPSVFARAINIFILTTLGRYLKLKSALLNRKLDAAHRAWDVFDVQCGEDHLLYESRRYASMRQRYDEVLTAAPEVKG
ncbi:MAG: hypothetical protein JRN12_02825 [Nitrososphaerota archaeon]|jgi:hypothetical protein|nr:hypothetical protein [Nitrososphaerota archaeon]MDG6950772.1 hypothetical protein [Nitrososphaerota archaeon]